MNGVTIGRVIRAVRLRLRLRQADLAARAGVSQSAVSRIERGLTSLVRLGELERICSALGIRLEFDATWRGTHGSRLLDDEHAALVELIVRELQALGWETAVEFGFNHYGERGSIDIVGWHAATRSLLLIEAKTLIVNVQELLSSMERKERLAPRLLAAERGWKPASVSTLLVIRESHPARDVLARQAATFDSALPVRTRAARRWLRAPVGRLAGVMFVTESRLRTISGARGRRSRVRRHRTTPLVHG